MRPDCSRTYHRPAVFMDQGEVRAVSAVIYRHGILSDRELSAANIAGVDPDNNRDFRNFRLERDVVSALDSSAVPDVVLPAIADRVSILSIRNSIHMLIGRNKHQTELFEAQERTGSRSRQV